MTRSRRDAIAEPLPRRVGLPRQGEREPDDAWTYLIERRLLRGSLIPSQGRRDVGPELAGELTAGVTRELFQLGLARDVREEAAARSRNASQVRSSNASASIRK